MLREEKLALEKRHRNKVLARQKANAQIARPSAGVSMKPGDLVLVRESPSVTVSFPGLHRVDHLRTSDLWRSTIIAELRRDKSAGTS